MSGLVRSILGAIWKVIKAAAVLLFIYALLKLLGVLL